MLARREALVGALDHLLTPVADHVDAAVGGRGLHSSTFQLNLSRVCHTKTPCTP